MRSAWNAVGARSGGTCNRHRPRIRRRAIWPAREGSGSAAAAPGRPDARRDLPASTRGRARRSGRAPRCSLPAALLASAAGVATLRATLGSLRVLGLRGRCVPASESEHQTAHLPQPAPPRPLPSFAILRATRARRCIRWPPLLRFGLRVLPWRGISRPASRSRSRPGRAGQPAPRAAAAGGRLRLARSGRAGRSPPALPRSRTARPVAAG